MKKIFYLVGFMAISALASAQWTNIGPYGGDERDGAFSFVINGTAYVGGGITSHDFWKFNPTTNGWQQMADIGDGRNRCFATAFVANGKGYTVGGDSSFGKPIDEVWSFDPAGGWKKMNNFPGGKRVGMFSFVIGNRVFAGGGTNNFDGNGFGTVYDDFYEYNVAADSWTKLPDMPQEVVFPASFVIDGKGYIVFGAKDNTQSYNNLYAFDTATMIWMPKWAFPGAARDAGVGFSLNGKGYAGLGEQGFTVNFNDFYEYNPVTDKWKKMTAAYPEMATGWAASFVLNGKAYVGTGLEMSTFNFTRNFYTFTGGTTGINQGWADNTTGIYPNPCTTEISLSNLPQGQQITISDIAGKVVASEIYLGNTLDVSHLQPGIYFLNAGGAVEKIVKQ